MSRQLFDLAASDPRVRFSPYCWRVRMALAHKELDVTTVPWRFTEKTALAFAKSQQVPVLVDDDVVIPDSMAIADYLEHRYPENPLFGSSEARAMANFVRHWVESVLSPGLIKQILVDIARIVAPCDVEYFRTTREARFGMSLEAVCADRDARLPEFRDTLQPLRLTLSGQKFLNGSGPGFSDYLVFGAFQWARCASSRVLLTHDDPVQEWLERILALYDGLGKNAPRATDPCGPTTIRP